MIKSLPKSLKIFLIVFAGIVLLTFLVMVGDSVVDFVYCHTVAFCDYPRPTISPKIIATQIPLQYEYAIQDMEAGRLKEAKQRLSYIMLHDPEYPGAKERLLEVEQLLTLTPAP